MNPSSAPDPAGAALSGRASSMRNSRLISMPTKPCPSCSTGPMWAPARSWMPAGSPGFAPRCDRRLLAGRRCGTWPAL